MSQNKTEPFYPHLSALLDELRTFPNETRQRGTESYKEDTVREAYFNSTDYSRTPKDITATVKEETIFVARWLLENRGGKSVWTHRCTCGTAYCHHLYAVGIATYASVEINHVTKSQQDAVREHLKENILDLCSGVPLSHDIARERIPEPPKIE
ncbi:MAG: hypothetical protein LBV28_02030, partial [Puniceicoccales bacterium]|nr:hypothetical protein [Puniceicoccales bacterium]